MFITIIISIFPISPVYTSPGVNLTVSTDKQIYHLRESVHIYGNLTWQNGTLIQDGLVGLEVDDPFDDHLTVRTLTTGTTPTESWLVEVIDVIPCNKSLHPKNEFERGTLAYFNVTVKNNDIEIRQALITITVYDESQVPLGTVGLFEGPIVDNSTLTVYGCVPIPETATVGNATVYANAYSGWPRIAGKPYCPEKSKTFKIVNGDGDSFQPPEEQSFEGNYDTPLKLSFFAQVGNYTVYVTTIYQGYAVVNFTTFEATVLGDANGDGMVDGTDLSMLGMAWLTTTEDPNYDERCDFDKDGTVDGLDLGILGFSWGYPSS